ncbi:MAG: T9SS type A sorting domain-containing protein [Patescibacteria group bacterium]
MKSTTFNILIIVGILFLTFGAVNNTFAQVPPPPPTDTSGGGGGGPDPVPCPGCPFPMPSPIIVLSTQSEVDQTVQVGNNNVIHAKFNLAVAAMSTGDIRVDRIFLTMNSFGKEKNIHEPTNLRLMYNGTQFGNTLWRPEMGSINFYNLNLNVTKGDTVELQILADVQYTVGTYNLTTQIISGTDAVTGIYYIASGTPLVHHNITVVTPPAVNPVTYGDFIKMVDTVFCINKMNLPEFEVPSTITTPAYRRMQALGFAYWSDEQSYTYPMYNWYLRSVIIGLFKNNQCNSERDEMSQMRWFLRDNGVNLDSAESVARGLPWWSYSITENDQLSASTVAYMAQAAMQKPVLVLDGKAAVGGDTISSNLTIYRNPYQLAAYQINLSANSSDWVVSVTGHNGFSARKGSGWSYCYYDYQRVGGMNAAGYNSNDFKLATVDMVLYNNITDIYQTDAILADVVGDNDFTAWTPKTRVYIYHRLDVNMNYNHTVADAVKLNNAYILPDSTPPVKNLGDGNNDNMLNGDDVPYNFNVAIGGFGKSTPKIIASNNPATGTVLITPVTMPDGKTKLLLSFTGDYGSTQRFTGKIHFNPQLAVESVTYPGTTIEELLNYRATDGLVSFARYDSSMSDEGTLVEIVLTGTGDLQLSMEYLKGSYFTTSENIAVEIAGVTGVGDEVNSTPKQFALQQNFPNPFNPTTTISYSLPIATNVTLKVYNMLGQEVSVLVNGEMEKGEHSVDFNAADLPSGVYIYKIQAGNFADFKKFILQK